MVDISESILEHVSDGFVTFDSDWRYRYVSPRAAEIIGFNAEDLLGRRMWDLFPQLRATEFERACLRAARNQETVAVEGQYDLTGRWIRCRLYPSPLQIVLIASDVTEHRAAVARLRESEERFRQLTENIREIFWLISVPSGEVIFMSPNHESIWPGVPVITAQDVLESGTQIHPSDRDKLVEGYEKAVAGEAAVVEYRMLSEDGEERWIRNRCFPVRDVVGRVHRIAGTTEDVSDRKALEAQLAQVQKMEAVGRLAGGIAHDFNNQLTAILGFARLLEVELDPASELGEYVSEILHAAERSAQLTNQLLAFGRRQVMQPQVLSIGEIVTNVDTMLRRLLGPGIDLVTLPGNATGRVKADPGHIEQVLVNLVLNARDAVPVGGRILVHVFDRRVGAPLRRSHGVIPAGDYVVLAVSDDGIGMDEATLQKMVEPFFTTRPTGEGTGLGMAMVYGIVHQSGGYLSVFSRPETGTTIKIYLPVIDDSAVPETRSRPVEDVEDLGTVLLVEDEPAIRVLARNALTRAGYHVLEAENGHQALRTWGEQQDRIDLVLTDLTMPGMSGKELGQRLAEDGRGIPIVYVSGYSDEFAFGDADRPPVHFLAKPFSPQELIAKVAQVLRTG